VYCGDPADTVDHLLPRSWTGDGYARSVVETVPSCKQCNSILGDRCGPDIDERRAYVQERLAAKYANEIKTIDWTMDDLAELGPSLRTHICAGLIRKRWVQARLAWPRPADWMLDSQQTTALAMWARMQITSDEDARALARFRR
jgi:hypothetical protein